MEDIELEDDEYVVEEIKDLRKIGSQWKYLVKWQGWPESYNTWELEENLTNCKSLVREYHRKNPQKRESDSRRKGSNQEVKGRKKKKSNQPVTSPGQSIVRVAMVRLPETPYQGRNSPQPPLFHDSEGSEWHDHGQRTLALAPRPLGARDEVVRSVPQNEQAQDAFDASQPQPFPTLPQL
ncbi:hypothetical protein ACJBU6_09574 [Exserohilum turcicum]